MSPSCFHPIYIFFKWFTVVFTSWFCYLLLIHHERGERGVASYHTTFGDRDEEAPLHPSSFGSRYFLHYHPDTSLSLTYDSSLHLYHVTFTHHSYEKDVERLGKKGEIERRYVQPWFNYFHFQHQSSTLHLLTFLASRRPRGTTTKTNSA